MRLSKDGKTLGITLRIPKTVLDAISTIANRENAIEIQGGGRGLKTVQDVMRQKLLSLPEVIAEMANGTNHEQ